MSRIELDKVSKSYGAVEAVAELSIIIEQGQFVTFLGPSGSGKTTTMRMIAGLEKISKGTISIDGKVVSGAGIFVPAHRRHLGMVFQSYAVWPHKTVEENVAFPLQQRSISRSDQKQRVRNILDRVGLGGYAHRYPSQLSGGQQQRVSLARALVAEPAVVLFDEPLSNLDAQLRDSMRELLAEMHRAFGTTSVYVTHDQEEAMVLSDMVHIMNQGRLIQSGKPEDLYDRPASRFVADFIGAANTLEVLEFDPSTGAARLKNGSLLKATPRGLPVGENVMVIRPHQIVIAHDNEIENVVEGSVHSVSYLGDRSRYSVEIGAGLRLAIELATGQPRLRPGQNIRLRLPEDACVMI